MRRLFCKYIGLPLVITAILISLNVPEARPVSAGLWISGCSLTAEASPGVTITHNFSVGTRDTDPPMDIQIDVSGMGQSLNGICQAVDYSKDTNPFSARQFITLDKSAFHLEPGDSQRVTASIHIPKDIGAGGRYAVISVYSNPAGEGPVNIISAIDIPIYLTLKKAELIHTGEVTEINVSKPTDGQSMHISTTLQNTGNHHFKAKGELIISDAGGQIVDIVHLAPTTSAVIPTMSKSIDAIFIPRNQLPSGTYSVKAMLMLEDGTAIDTAGTTFAIEKPYIPEPAPATITLTPNSTSQLKTEGGEISIIFPAGAIEKEAIVSLRDYPLTQIPSLPEGYEPASTAFRIDGLSGALEKKVSVTVKFTQADLEKANGDASRLRLARWDEAKSKWQFLPTQVDTATTSLSADTSQFSIWAITVAPRSNGTNWWPAICTAAGIAIIGALAYIFVRKRTDGSHL